MPESTQHKLDRIRPPRVQITYDVETRGSFVKKELPFVVGILADLAGNVDDPNPTPLRDRKYVEIDRDNFNDIMKSIGPKAKVTSGETLSFAEIGDFSPIKVLKQLDNVHASYKKRTHLSDMVAKIDGNVKLQTNLVDKLMDKDKLKAMKDSISAIRAALPKKPEAAAEPEKPQTPPETPTEGEGGKN